MREKPRETRHERAVSGSKAGIDRCSRSRCSSQKRSVARSGLRGDGAGAPGAAIVQFFVETTDYRLLNRTRTTCSGASTFRSSSSITALARSGANPPDPAPIWGKARDRKPWPRANWIAFRTESRIDRSEARQSRLIPATWMIALNGEPTRRSQDGPAQRDRPVLAKFFERLCTASMLDCPRDALGQQEPPRDDVAVPGVDDHVNGLVEQIALDDGHIHGAALRALQWAIEKIPRSATG